MAERLGTGLQNPLHRFESGSDLKKNQPSLVDFFYNYFSLNLFKPAFDFCSIELLYSLLDLKPFFAFK
jgi:hypothetical protein